MRWLSFAGCLFLAMGILAACANEPTPNRAVPGDPEVGAELIESYDCGTCHRIPGIDSADGRVAPSLNLWPNRAFVAGMLPNTPENLSLFIQDPQQVKPGVGMPDLGVTEEQAQDISAYLWTLR